MTWLMWRQHRTEALALAIAVGGLAIGLYVLGRPLYALFPHGPTACLGLQMDQSCRTALAGLEQGAGGRVALLVLLNFVPFAIGGLLGAPLLARELEAGTWQLAWTQTVPRRQWLAVKVVVLGLLAIALASGLSAAIAWYRRPLDVVGGFDITGFDLTGVAPLAYALFAFALGVAAGTLLRRALPAAAVALVVFVAVRVTVTAWVRPHLVTPLTDLDGGEHLRDLVLQRGFIDNNGRSITGLDAAMVEARARENGADPALYLHEHGLQFWVVYQPADRYWTFQLIEAALYVGLAVLLLSLVFLRIRRHPA